MLSQAKIKGKTSITINKKSITKAEIEDLEECGYIVKTLNNNKILIKE